jgi:hypothetical protein
MGAVDPDRIAVPVPADRRPAATTLAAALIARQAGLGLEFVATGGGRHAAELRSRCDVAAAAGVPWAGWQLLDGSAADIGSYVTWSGARWCCVGTQRRRHGPALGGAAVGIPVLFIGPSWRPGDGVVRRVVVGLAGWPRIDGPTTSAAAALAARLGAELTMIEVIDPNWRPVDVPACAHLLWVARELNPSPASFDTIAAPRPDDGLGRFLDAATVAVVGAPTHHRHLLGGVAGRLVRRAPGPVLVVPGAR